MKFFDRKEEVIDLQFTQHGKRLLAQGKLKPVYYAFSDDDILYDTAYAGFTEVQNDTIDRIKTTPRLKTQYNLGGVESEFNRLTKQNLGMGSSLLAPDKRDVEVNSVGTAAIGNQKAPAWKINFLKGEISSSSGMLSPDSTLNKSGPILNVPQIEALITYTTSPSFFSSPYENLESEEEEQFSGLDSEDLLSMDYEFDDGSRIEVDREFLVLEVSEENSLFANSNFDIEIFKVEDERNDLGVKTGKEKLLPLYFAQKNLKKSFINDQNILIEKGDRGYVSNILNYQNPDLDVGAVEYFLDIEVDAQIDDSVMCDLNPPDRLKGVYSKRFFNCRPDEAESRDIYGPEEDYEDPCD